MPDESLLNSPHLLGLIDETVHGLIDSCIMDGILQMHRAIKLGYFHVIAPDVSNEDDTLNSTSVVRSGANGTTTSGRDNSMRAAGCCRCVKCHSKVAATRFAPHLSNCMGLGRNSSRRANKRIAEQQRLEDYDDDLEDDYQTYIPAAPSHSTSSTLHTSASDSAIIRFSNEAHTTQQHATTSQHSPLKLTISLIPSSGRSDSNTKHVIRAMSTSGLSDTCSDSNRLTNRATLPTTRMTSTSTVGSRSELQSTKAPVIMGENNAMMVRKVNGPFERPLILNEAKVELTKHDYDFTVVNR